MNMKTISPLLLFSVFGLMACNNIKEPEFRKVDKFGLRNLSLQEATVGFEVTYHNPNNFGVTVKEAEADVYIDSTYLGKFIQDKTIDVSKGADFSIRFSQQEKFFYYLKNQNSIHCKFWMLYCSSGL